MDMKCNKCGEPWDWFYIRDEVLVDQPLYSKMEKLGGYVHDFGGPDKPGKPIEVQRCEQANWQFIPGPYIEKCPCCINYWPDTIQDDNSKIRAELASLYGDDIDGFMADCEDFGL